MKTKIILILLLTLLCSGCGFKLRSASALPAALHTFYFSTEKPYSMLSTQLKILYRSLHIHLVKKKSLAQYSILISNDNFTYSRPDVVDASLPTGISFSQSATITIKNNHTQKIVATQSFVATQSITLNANQIYTSNANELIKQALNRDMTSYIYYWLSSLNTKAALAHAKSH